MDRVLSALGSRVFLMNDVREPGPIIFQTRHTLASAVRSANRAKKAGGDVARVAEQRAALHQKWAELQAEANAKLAALQAKARGPALAISRAQIAPRKADIDVGTLVLTWLPFRRDASGNPSYAFALG